MANQYVLIFLVPGQQTPIGAQGVVINEGIVCIVDGLDCAVDRLNQKVIKGTHLDGDIEVSDYYSMRTMTVEEIELFCNPPVDEEMYYVEL